MRDLVEHLLTHLTEEAAEIVQRVQKIERFGLDEIQEGKNQTNRRRLEQEVNQFEAVVLLLRKYGVLSTDHQRDDINQKHMAMVHYGSLSVSRGKLDAAAYQQLCTGES